MDFDLIQRRSEELYEILDDKQKYGEIEDVSTYLHALKASYLLKTKSVRDYIKAFRHNGTYFCIKEVELVFEEYADYIPGQYGISEEEIEILKEAQEAIDLQSRVRSIR